MAFLDHEGSIELSYSKDVVFDALLEAITKVNGFTVHTSDKGSGYIMVKAGVSLFSWGENIPIALSEISPNKTKVSITSTPKTGVLFGGAADFGKNRKNIESIIEALIQTLKDKVPVEQISESANDISTRLAKLQELYDSKLISEKEYNTTKAKILSEL